MVAALVVYCKAVIPLPRHQVRVGGQLAPFTYGGGANYLSVGGGATKLHPNASVCTQRYRIQDIAKLASILPVV